jgi:DNA-binding NarL/FixJ family response regulator
LSKANTLVNLECVSEIGRYELISSLSADSIVAMIYTDPNSADPLEVLRKIRHSQPKVKIIFIGREIDLKVLIELFRSGLDDYLLEPIKQVDIDQAIQRLRDHNRRVKFNPRQYGLTNREIEVCSLLIKGLKSKDIAAYLQITPATIKVHKARIMKKLNVNSLPDLVRKTSPY